LAIALLRGQLSRQYSAKTPKFDRKGRKILQISNATRDVYDFLRKLERFQIVCEASALPLSQAGVVQC
jgi:hypothetical protein